jgi:hypothetical protein
MICFPEWSSWVIGLVLGLSHVVMFLVGYYKAFRKFKNIYEPTIDISWLKDRRK